MQPILVLALIGVAATAAVGAGFLDPAIVVTAQNFGAGEDDLESPAAEAMVDFNIVRHCTNQGTPDEKCRNVVDECWIKFDELKEASEVTCKLTDMNDSVIAEGTGNCPASPGAETVCHVNIDPADVDAFNSDVVDVQDVIILVKGASTGAMP